MIRILQSRWFAVLTGTLVYLAVTLAVLDPGRVLTVAARAAAAAEAPVTTVSWEFTNPEMEQLIAELKQQRQALITKEQQLNELATRLEAERAELNVVAKGIQRMQTDMDKVILRVREEETPNLKKLAKVYGAMTPDGAASIFRQMDDDQAAKIFVFMKDTETAPIFENLAKLGEAEAKRAAALSEKVKRAVFRSSTPSQ
jgi:flagellar motility protein MotE (MotC chaperone)